MILNSSKEDRRYWNKLLRARNRANRLHQRLELIESCLLHIGLSDGPLNDTEIEHLSHSLDRLATSNRVAEYQAGDAIRMTLSEIQSAALYIIPQISIRRSLLRELFSFSECDGPINEAEERAIIEIGEAIKIPTERMDRIKRKHHHQHCHALKTIPHHYLLLGCTPDDPDDVIKRAYRQLAARVHPDKHVINGHLGDEAAQYVVRFRELQEAYEQICKDRTQQEIHGTRK